MRLVPIKSALKRFASLRVVPLSAAKIGTAEVRVGQVCVPQVHFDHTRGKQGCPTQICVPQVCPVAPPRDAVQELLARDPREEA
jgi:hypothetical protein